MQEKTVTVIINTYPRNGRREDLERALNSITNQNYKDFKILIIENFADDSKIKDIVSEYPDDNLRVICDPKKRLSYLFNLGWKNADTELLGYLADDAEADKTWLEGIVAELNGDEKIGVITGPLPSQCYPVGEMHRLYLASQKNLVMKIIAWPYLNIVAEGNILKPGYFFESGAYSLGTALPEAVNFDRQEIDLATTTSMGTRRSIIEKIGGFDERFNFNHADGDLFIRVKAAGFKIIFSPLVSAKHFMRLGPSRNAYFIGKDTGMFYRKDVRPKSLRGWIGAIINIKVLNLYWVYSALRLRDLSQLRGISGFFEGFILL